MDKEDLRSTLTEFGDVTSEQSKLVGNHLFGFLSKRIPGTITTYSALEDEVDTSPLIDRLPGWRWLLPRIEDDGSLSWRDARVDLERHRWGMDQPNAKAPVTPVMEVDVFLVPGVAFDAEGNRIGRGGGYYDRELALKRPDAVAIGVTLSKRIVDAVPTDEHDRRVDYLADETGVRSTNSTN